MEIKFIKYDDKFCSQVFPGLVPQGYYNKYTSRSLFYRFLRFTGLYKSDLYLLIGENRVSGCILLRRRFTFTIVGFRWFIYGVAITPKQRGRGYGNLLIENCLDYCKMHNINDIYLYVDMYNTNALNLYSKHGFQIIKGGNCLTRSCNRHKNKYLMSKVLD